MEKKLFWKTLVIGFIILFIGASALPIVGSQTQQIQPELNVMNPASMRGWSDDFSAYTLGQFLDGDTSDGGWKGWDNDPQYGAFVVDDQELSVPHSVEVVDNVDLVHEFGGYTAGQWTFTTWIYVPDDFIGNSYFILLSDYTDGAGQDNKWAVQLRFDGDQGIVESEHDAISVWLLTGQWVEIRCEIDLDTDWLEMYYDGSLLHSKAWTAGPNNQGDGFLNIAAVDLFANAASVVYYDDFALEGEGPPIPNLECDGSLGWTEVEPGTTVSGEFYVGNLGETGSLLDWEVTEWPEWGTGWTFTPMSGTGLADGDWETVAVDVVAPDTSNTEFNGTVKVENSNDPSDFCEIAVVLETPLNNQQSTQGQLLQLIQQVLARF